MAQQTALEVLLTLNDQLTGQLNQASSAVAKAAEKVTKIGAGFVALGAAPTAAAVASVKMAADFEDAMLKVQSVTGSAQDNFNQLTQLAMEMGKTTKFHASEAADAMYYMGLAGWEDQEIMDGLNGVMMLSAASGVDLATTSDIVTDALTAMGYSAADASHFADVLAQTSRSSNTNVDLLGGSFKYVAPLAGTLGYSIEDLSVALGLMANQGIKGDQAGTSLRSVLTNLAAPTDKLWMLMDELGVSLTDTSGQMLPLSDLLVDLRANFAGMTAEEQAANASIIAGKYGMSGFLAIMNATDEEFASLTNQIANADGTAQAMADTMESGIGGTMRRMSSMTETLSINVGNALAPSFNNLLESLAPILDKVTLFVQENPDLVATILEIGVALGAVGAAMVAAGAILSGLSMLLDPFALVLMGIIAVVVLLYKAWTENWGGIQEKTQEVLNFLQPFIDVVTQGFSEIGRVIAEDVIPFFQQLWEKVTVWIDEIWTLVTQFFQNNQDKIETFQKIWEVVWNAIVAVFKNVWAVIKAVITVAWEVVSGIIKTGLQILNGDWEGAWETIKTTFANVWDAIWNMLVSVWNNIKEFWDKSLGTMIDIGKNLVEGLWNGISSMTGWIGEKISGFVRGITDKFKDLFGIASPSKVFAEMGRFNIAGLEEGMKAAAAALDLPTIAANITTDFGRAFGPLQIDTSQLYGGRYANNDSYSDSHDASVTFTGDIVINDDLDVESVAQYIGAMVANVVY